MHGAFSMAFDHALDVTIACGVQGLDAEQQVHHHDRRVQTLGRDELHVVLLELHGQHLHQCRHMILDDVSDVTHDDGVRFYTSAERNHVLAACIKTKM